jgi:hypothetical protein
MIFQYLIESASAYPNPKAYPNPFVSATPISSLPFVLFVVCIYVQVSMSERQNGQLPLAKRVRSRISADVWQQVRTAYASGIGLREIARNMSIPEGTVLARAKREGWTQQIQSVKALAKREGTSPSVTEAVAVTMQQRGERHTGRVAGLTERMLMTFEQLSEGEQLRFVDELEKIDKIGRRTFGLDTENGHGGNVMVNVALLEIPPERMMVAKIEASGDSRD